MDHFIEHLSIRNFKSIREMDLEGFKRINLFIGRPNVGKSNFLEALGLLGLQYFSYLNLTYYFRIKHSSGLFFNGNFEKSSDIYVYMPGSNNTQSYSMNCEVIFFENERKLEIKLTRGSFPTSNNASEAGQKTSLDTYVFDKSLNLAGEYHLENKADFDSSIKRYTFREDIKSDENDTLSFLIPPFGQNLFQTLEFLPDLRQTIAGWFRQYGLRLVMDRTSQEIKAQKELGDDEVFILPYSSLADTLQRIIFYKTAIRSNQNSVLLFEEPEAHAYPQYISEFTQEVIRSETNQFFIVTHSPYVVGNFLEDEEAFNDLAIFMVDFKDGQTVTRPLSAEELIRVRRYGIDLFFNGDQFLD